jgi:hypothetical protein
MGQTENLTEVPSSMHPGDILQIQKQSSSLYSDDLAPVPSGLRSWAPGTMLHFGSA